MFRYDKKLQYPVKIDRPNPKLARIILTQYGGPDGELGASLRYLSQRYSMPFDELKGLLTDIGTEGALWHPASITSLPHNHGRGVFSIHCTIESAKLYPAYSVLSRQSLLYV